MIRLLITHNCPCQNHVCSESCCPNTIKTNVVPEKAGEISSCSSQVKSHSILCFTICPNVCKPTTPSHTKKTHIWLWFFLRELIFTDRGLDDFHFETCTCTICNIKDSFGRTINVKLRVTGSDFYSTSHDKTQFKFRWKNLTSTSLFVFIIYIWDVKVMNRWMELFLDQTGSISSIERLYSQQL